MITQDLIEECKVIIARWKAQGRIKVLPPLHPGMTKCVLNYERQTKPLAASSWRNKRRFKV